MPTRRMSRSLSKKYLSTTRCINPGDPGCGRSRKSGIKSDRQLRKEQNERTKELEQRLKEKEIMRNGIVKRQYMMENESSGRPGKRRGITDDKMWKGENVAGGQGSAKKGTKLKAVKRLTKAQGGAKTPKDSSLIKRYSGPPFIKPKKPKAQYGVAKKSSKK